MQVTAGLIADSNKLLLKIHGNKSTSKEVIHIPSYRSEVIYGGTWFSNSRGVVCKMLKQVIWKVLSKRVVSDSGDKLLLPCLYLATTSFHAGQGLYMIVFTSHP